MYRRLEPKPSQIKAKALNSESACMCACKAVQPKDGPPQPEANQTAMKLAVHYEISG